MMRQLGTTCRLAGLIQSSGPAMTLIRAFAAQAAKPAQAAAPKGGKPAAPNAADKAAGSGAVKNEQSKAAASAEIGYAANVVEPLRPSTIVVQLRAKAFHPFYINRYAVALASKFEEQGLPRPSQVFLPKKTERWTVLKSPHVDKKAREQFERITHKRLFQFKLPDTRNNIEFAYRVLTQVTGLAPGVEVRAKYLTSSGSAARSAA